MVPVCRGAALSACHVVRPCELLRRLQVLLQELLLELQLLMGDQPHRASFVPAADSGAGSGSTTDSDDSDSASGADSESTGGSQLEPRLDVCQ